MISDEEAKAAQELAKTTNTALEKSGDLGSYVARTLGDLPTELFGIATDWVKAYRLKQAIKLREEILVEFKARGIRDPKELSPGFVIPYLEAATLVEDDELRSMWVRLLANAADSSFQFEVSSSYLDILRQFGPLEARCLQLIADCQSSYNPDVGVWTADLPKRVLEHKPYSDDGDQPTREVMVALNNLSRLGCLDSNLVWSSQNKFSCVSLTPLGAALIEACSYPKV